MSKVLEKLTEGIVNRSLREEGVALLTKWERTGLLEGLDNDHARAGMARLLENQAAQLLKESTSMAGGDVQGFSSVAFPLVRRVFAGLLANDLVSVQPMSLPSGLIFFLDFTTSTDIGGAASGGLPKFGYGSTAESLYGGGVVGSQITGGVSLTGANAETGPYALNNGYASPTGSIAVAAASVSADSNGVFVVGNSATTDKLIRFDPDLASGTYAMVVNVTFSAAQADTINLENLVAITGSIAATGSVLNASGSTLIRRLTEYSPSTRVLSLVYHKATTFGNLVDSIVEYTASVPLKDAFTATNMPLGAVVGASQWGLEEQTRIPEIDIKVDSIAVTAVTKKLKAKWTPELGQDLNAYHNLDAEVELTSILSEQIALEIDREILEDLIKGATAGTFYWSRSPGLFVDRTTGVEVGASAKAPDFTGNVSMWYETLIETINDVSAQIHRKTLRGGANFVVTSPEVANILEFTAGFRASVTADDERGSIGAVKVGSISKKFDVHVDPYFPRNLLLVGRRGGSFLESGYVYAPYVPLQVTPTIFGTEDFVPRKGVMTRYAKKMVRPDMYGLVVVRGLLGESGT